MSYANKVDAKHFSWHRYGMATVFGVPLTFGWAAQSWQSVPQPSIDLLILIGVITALVLWTACWEWLLWKDWMITTHLKLRVDTSYRLLPLVGAIFALSVFARYRDNMQLFLGFLLVAILAAVAIIVHLQVESFLLQRRH